MLPHILMMPHTNVCDTTSGSSSKFDWRPATRLEKLAKSSCTLEAEKKNVLGKANKTDLKCVEGRWVATATFDADARELTFGGQTYRTVVIGNQTWMAKNLNYDDSTVYTSMENRSWCYNDEADSCAKYGRLYTWSAAMDSASVFSDAGKGCGIGGNCASASTSSSKLVRGICPEGWHLPSKNEWNALFTVVGGESSADTYLKSTSGWDSRNGTDSFGFSVLPAGFYDNGSFDGVGNSAHIWAGTEYSSNYAYALRFYSFIAGDALVGGRWKNYGCSIRCIKDLD